MPFAKSCSCNEQAFDDLSDPAVQYWLGMLAGDGWISVKAENRKQLGLGLKDEEHVHKFKRFLKSDYALSASNGSFKHVVYSRYLVDRLIDLGVSAGKSRSRNMYAIDKLAWSHHYWRGAIDADGHVTIHRNRYLKIGLTNGSWSWLKQWKIFVESIVNKDLAISTNDRNIHTYQITGAAAVELGEILYSDSTPDIRLDRKYAIAEKYIEGGGAVNQ